MDQLMRDYTYRLDALRSVCEPAGWKGTECLSLLDVWSQTHTMNLFNEWFFSNLWYIAFVGLTIFGIYDIIRRKRNHH